MKMNLSRVRFLSSPPLFVSLLPLSLFPPFLLFHSLPSLLLSCVCGCAHAKGGGGKLNSSPPFFSHVSLSPPCSLSRDKISVARRGGRRTSPSSLCFSLFPSLSLSLATEIPSRGEEEGKASLSSPLPLFHDLCSSLSLSHPIFSLLHLLLFYPSFATEDLALFHLFHLLLVS